MSRGDTEPAGSGSLAAVAIPYRTMFATRLGITVSGDRELVDRYTGERFGVDVKGRRLSTRFVPADDVGISKSGRRATQHLQCAVHSDAVGD